MKRFRLAPAVLAVLVGLCALVFAGTAGAYHVKNSSEHYTTPGGGGPQANPPYLGFDPMETSIPYLAWRGEEIRLVKCFDRSLITASTGRNLNVAFAAAEWQVMEWSGDQHNWPKFYDDLDQKTGRFEGMSEQSGRDCFAIDITSHKAGIATVKMSVDSDDVILLDDISGTIAVPNPNDGTTTVPVPENDSQIGSRPLCELPGTTPIDNCRPVLEGEGDPFAKHQFVVIWMSLRRPILRCLGPGTEEPEDNGPLFDDEPIEGCPGAGPVTENPEKSNRLGALVKGDVPLTEQFQDELGAQNPALDAPSIVLPDAWQALSTTTLASISHQLRISNNGVQNDPGVLGPGPQPWIVPPDINPGFLGLTRDSPTGTPASRQYNEPTHTAGDFWDIHDSTGPLNSGVYGPDQPLTVPDFCPGPEAANHNAVCHVSQAVTPPSGDEDCAGDWDPRPENSSGPTRATLNAGRDTVDNCDSSQWGDFSRVFHDTSAEFNEPTIGPFAPTRPDETLLSDSEVNAHDAPMPAAVVIASIAPNPGSGISGAGFLTGVDKHIAYNRGGANCDNTGTPAGDHPENKHCLPGPFYGAYIPPVPAMEANRSNPNGTPAQVQKNPTTSTVLTDDRDNGAGIIGSFANNFDGYLPVFYRNPLNPAYFNKGLYHYWDVIEVTRQVASGVELPEACEEQDFEAPGNGDDPRERVQEIVLYTDEHGEAQFQYNAGEQFFPDAFTVDEQQFACIPEDLLGTASITVSARYPFQPHTHAGATSLPLVKNIESLWHKGVVCVEKTFHTQSALCVVFARSIEGEPLDEEIVCLSVGEVSPTADVMGVAVLDPPYEQTFRSDRTACGETDDEEPPGIDLSDPELPLGEDCERPEVDEDGEFDDYAFIVFEVDTTGTGDFKATAVFEDENIKRDCHFSLPFDAVTTGSSVGQGGSGSNGSSSSSGVGGASQPNVVLPGGKVAADGLIIGGGPRANGSSRADNQPSSANKPAAAKKRASIVFVRIVKPLRQGAVRSVILRVKSPQKTARISLKLIGPRGKVLGTLMRKVKTNRTVRVPNLRVPTRVVNVRVKLIA